MKRPNIYAKHTLLEMHVSPAGEIAEEQRALLKDRNGMRAIEPVIQMMDPDFKINRIAVWRNQSAPPSRSSRTAPQCDGS